MKTIISAAVTALLALSLSASPALAQRGGRGGGGRSFGGNRSFSSARVYRGGGSYYRGGGGYYRGGGAYYRGGGYYRGGYGGYGYRGYGWGGLGLGLAWPYYYGGASYAYPYYYDNYAYPYVQTPILYDDTVAPYAAAPVILNAQQPADNATVPSTQGATALAGAGANSNARQSFYSGPTASTGQTELIVKVPTSDAQVSLGSMQSEQSGTERQFYFPALSGDTSFTIRGQWLENGKIVTREKQVDVRPGQTTTLDFSKEPAGKSKQPTSYTPR